jgi:hypothetical protein
VAGERVTANQCDGGGDVVGGALGALREGGAARSIFLAGLEVAGKGLAGSW